ncbi:MAG: flagellar biosynthesis protein FlhF [bacterium]|nr:flagellar biosynthesis protein FlhF [bacterium]
MLKYDTFIGKDMQEAMTKMRMALGPDAMILKHRVVNAKAFWGLVKRPMVEVIGFKSDKINLLKPDDLDSYKPRVEEQEKAQSPVPETLSLQKELEEIKKILTGLTRKDNPSLSQEEVILSDEDKIWNKFSKMMKETGLSDEFTDKILEVVKKEVDIKSIEDENAVMDKIKAKLRETIEISDPVKGKNKFPRIFMFVGPTGVGKTTSLVKLAANLKLKEDREIEIYSLDNYRIAATEQLKTYCDIMQIPFRKFDNKADFKNTIKKSKADIILLDTAGRSPKDEISISALKDYMKQINIYHIDIFLVISASTKKEDILDISDKYSRLGYQYLLLTKLDETVTLGTIVDSLFYLKKPLTYVTFGQDVPKHISLANAELMIDTIFNKES